MKPWTFGFREGEREEIWITIWPRLRRIHACASRMNTSSLKSRNGETRECCQQLSHQRRRGPPACSLAIIVPPWIVNPAERPSEIITAPRDVVTARGATDNIYKLTDLSKKDSSLRFDEFLSSVLSFLLFVEKRNEERKRVKANKNFGPGSSETIKRARLLLLFPRRDSGPRQW